MKSELEEPSVLKSIIKSIRIRYPVVNSLQVAQEGRLPEFLPLLASFQTISSQSRLQILVPPVDASLDLISPPSMLSFWKVSPTQRWALPGKCICSHGLYWSSSPLFQVSAGFCHPSELTILFKAELITFPLNPFSFPVFIFSFVKWPHHCFEPGHHPSVFPLAITRTPLWPYLLSHEITYVYLWGIFLKGVLPTSLNLIIFSLDPIRASQLVFLTPHQSVLHTGARETSLQI